MHQLEDGKPHADRPGRRPGDRARPGAAGVRRRVGRPRRRRRRPGNGRRHGRLTVPPGDPRYTLRRVWLTREEEQGYYYGFSNEGLWPLCHLAHERPIFRAATGSSTSGSTSGSPTRSWTRSAPARPWSWCRTISSPWSREMLKAARPDLRVGIFWHIPWPNPEAFRICPWRDGDPRRHARRGPDRLPPAAVLQQLPRHRRPHGRGAARLGPLRRRAARPSIARASVPDQRRRAGPSAACPRARTWPSRSPSSESSTSSATPKIIVGVDRIDYTKGLPERFRAVGRFLEKYPQHRGQVHVRATRRAEPDPHPALPRPDLAELESLADEINWKFQTDDWKPIRFLVAHHDAPTVHAFMRMARVCIVSSLHDGMNLVAKEYVAAQGRTATAC